MPGPARAKVKVNSGVILVASQIYISRIVHKTQAAPNAAVEVAAGVLEVALKIAVAIVGGLKNPGVKIHARPGILATRLDDQVAVHRAREFVGCPDARARHEEKRVLGCVGTLSVQRSHIFKSADGKIMADPSLYLEQAQPRGHGYAGGQGHANSGQPVIVAVLIAETELALHRRAFQDRPSHYSLSRLQFPISVLEGELAHGHRQCDHLRALRNK